MTPPSILTKRPCHKWFSATHFFAESWFGPFDSFEQAASAAFDSEDWEIEFVCVTQGCKLTKAEIEEQGADYSWECDTPAAVAVYIPIKGDAR